MSQQTITIYICVDHDGNYAAIGSSKITDLNKNIPLSIIEDEVKKPGVNAVTESFSMTLTLPEPPIEDEQPKEENDEVNDVSQ